MELRCLSAISVGLLLMGVAAAQQPVEFKRTNGHPDLSGLWAYAVDLPAGGIKKESNGKVTVKQVDLTNRRAPKSEVKGALPFTAAPAYKPEFQAKVKDLIDHESRTDPVFYCGRPGVPSQRRRSALPSDSETLLKAGATTCTGTSSSTIPNAAARHRHSSAVCD